MILATRNGLSPDIEPYIERLERLLLDLKRIRDGKAPSRKDLAGAPIIDAYVLTARSTGCLAGVVHGHPYLRGPVSVTSELWVFAPDFGWARTLSRFYALGSELEADGSRQ